MTTKIVKEKNRYEDFYTYRAVAKIGDTEHTLIASFDNKGGVTGVVTERLYINTPHQKAFPQPHSKWGYCFKDIETVKKIIDYWLTPSDEIIEEIIYP